MSNLDSMLEKATEQERENKRIIADRKERERIEKEMLEKRREEKTREIAEKREQERIRLTPCINIIVNSINKIMKYTEDTGYYKYLRYLAQSRAHKCCYNFYALRNDKEGNEEDIRLLRAFRVILIDLFVSVYDDCRENGFSDEDIIHACNKFICHDISEEFSDWKPFEDTDENKRKYFIWAGSRGLYRIADKAGKDKGSNKYLSDYSWKMKFREDYIQKAIFDLLLFPKWF